MSSPTRYPLTNEDQEKYNEKKVEFRALPVDGALLSGKGATLRVSTNGTDGRAEIHADDWANPEHTSILTRVINLTEEAFRNITSSGDGFVLDWSGRVNRR
jgi:hypothetical protein